MQALPIIIIIIPMTNIKYYVQACTCTPCLGTHAQNMHTLAPPRMRCFITATPVLSCQSHQCKDQVIVNIPHFNTNSHSQLYKCYGENTEGNHLSIGATLCAGTHAQHVHITWEEHVPVEHTGIIKQVAANRVVHKQCTQL